MSVEQFPMGPIREEPPESEKDVEKKLFDMLADQMQDPYLVEVHDRALGYAQNVNESGEDPDRLIEQFTGALDSAWGYHDQELELTAPVWIGSRSSGIFALEGCIQLVGQKVVSHGFIFRKKVAYHDREGLKSAPIRAAHYVEIPPQEQWPDGLHAAAFIDDIQQISTPYPSQEMREKNFKYYHPELVALIDGIIEGAQRPDQAIRDIAAFSIEVDGRNAESVEFLQDCAAYLRAALTIDPIASYRMGIQGDVLCMTEDDETQRFTVVDEWRRTIRIEGIGVMPRFEEMSSDEPRVTTHYPVIIGTVLEPEAGVPDREFYIPCDAIQWISSSRYDNTLPSTFVPLETISAEREE